MSPGIAVQLTRLRLARHLTRSFGHRRVVDTACHCSADVPLIVALTVTPARGGKTREVVVNLREQPEPGEIIELPDGTRVMIDRVGPSSRDGIDAEVSATRYS